MTVTSLSFRVRQVPTVPLVADRVVKGRATDAGGPRRGTLVDVWTTSGGERIEPGRLRAALASRLHGGARPPSDLIATPWQDPPGARYTAEWVTRARRPDAGDARAPTPMGAQPIDGSSWRRETLPGWPAWSPRWLSWVRPVTRARTGFVRATKLPVFDGQGRVVGTQGIFSDTNRWNPDGVVRSPVGERPPQNEGWAHQASPLP
jgi:hypothetical protein